MDKSTRVQPVRGWVRVDGIDCLRALAIFYVLLNHVNMHLLFTSLHYLRSVPPAVANAVVWQGQAGVQIFFSVSGFLITATSIRRWGSLGQVNVREFYLLRLARIAPLMVTLLVILSVLHGLHVREFVVSQRVGGLKSALIAALTLRVGLLEASRGYLPGSWDVLWSLSVEEVFYLGFPLACRVPGRGRWLIAVLLVFVVLGPFGRTVLAHGNETWQEYSYLGGMDAIALGCLTALLTTRRKIHAMPSWAAPVGIAILVFCLGFSGQTRALHLDASGLRMTLLSVGACLLIAASYQSLWRVPAVFSPLLAYGRRSYEVYLTHMFVVVVCFNVFMKETNRSLRLVPFLFLVVIGLAGVLGEVVGRFYSEPLNRAIRRRFLRVPTEAGPVQPIDQKGQAALP